LHGGGAGRLHGARAGGLTEEFFAARNSCCAFLSLRSRSFTFFSYFFWSRGSTSCSSTFIEWCTFFARVTFSFRNLTFAVRSPAFEIVPYSCSPCCVREPVVSQRHSSAQDRRSITRSPGGGVTFAPEPWQLAARALLRRCVRGVLCRELPICEGRCSTHLLNLVQQLLEVIRRRVDLTPAQNPPRGSVTRLLHRLEWAPATQEREGRRLVA
jgi:hypothetical protein